MKYGRKSRGLLSRRALRAAAWSLVELLPNGKARWLATAQ